jgi:PAS domain S-box-containing protein
LSFLLTFFGAPAPISRSAAIGVTIAIVLYNLPAALTRQLAPRLMDPILVLGLAGDFFAATAWLLLTGGDAQITFLVYGVVAIEAAATYGWAGAVGFMIAFLGMLGARVWELAALFRSSPPADAYLARSAVVLTVAVVSGAVAGRLHRLREGLAVAAAALQQERNKLEKEAADRRQVEETLGSTEQRLSSMVRNAPVALLAVDRQGKIVLCEGAALAALGQRPGQWVGWSVRELYADKPEIVEYIRQALSGETVHATIRDSGRTLAASYGPSRDTNGELVGAIGVSLDITEQEQVEAALREQTELYQALIRAQSDLGDLVIVSEGDRPIFMNAAVSQISGYTRAELDALPSIYTLVPEAERDQLRAGVGRPQQTPGARRFAATMRHKDGRRIEIEAAQLTVQTGGAPRTFTIARDVTERRQVEAQRQALLNRLVTVQEEERRQIASDIHDDSIQTMFAVKMRLHLLRAEITDQKHLAMLVQLDQAIDEAITRLRRLLFDLRPVALDQEGLVAAMRVYLDQMRVESGIGYQLDASLETEPDPEVRAIIYRVGQEALANVRKHAQATRVMVSVSERDGGVRVRIKDDGRGFSAQEMSRPRPGHLGIAAMRERAEMAGGSLEVSSSPGRGAEVEYWIPRSTASAAPAA